LDGIREVTAAHEMLHAAYIRMNNDDKSKVDTLLEVEYKKLENNKNFMERMDFYARTEPGQRYNELHSVIGTEVAEVSSELETYYDKYFSDRQKVVELNIKYSSVFQKLESRANELSEQLSTLESDISNRSAQYNTDVQILNHDIATFNRQVSNGEFSSQEQSIYERATLMDRAANLDVVRTEINNDITKYHSILSEYNSIASQSKKLNNLIDSTLAPAPSI
jgi:hypothetical protein